MASQQVLATPPSKDAILDAILKNVHAYNARQPRLYVGACQTSLEAEMPLLLKPSDAPHTCQEAPAVFEAVEAHFSAQVHAFFQALHGLEEMAAKQAADEPALIRPDAGLWPTIRVVNQSFDVYPDCWHRVFHTRRLAVRAPEDLPILGRATQLHVLPELDASLGPGLSFAHVRPVSPRVPFDLATRLPSLRRIDCPWLWERFPVAFSSQALRRSSRVWEGPWRDARFEFGRGVRHAMPLLPSSLATARLWFWKPNPYGDDADQAAPMPNLVDASPTSGPAEGDPVSLGLRELGSRLEELDVRALIAPDLFRLGSGGWPRMRHLRVEFHPCAPDGSWYFSGPRGEDDRPTGFAITSEDHYPPGREDSDETDALLSSEEDEYGGEGEITEARQPDMFRTLPIAERITPLLLAFAASLQSRQMPSIEDAELFTWLTWRPSEERARDYEGSDDGPPSAGDEYVMFRWGVRYDAPKGDGSGKVTWQVGQDWRPADHVVGAFASLVGGDEARMEWKDFEYVDERETDPDAFM